VINRSVFLPPPPPQHEWSAYILYYIIMA